MAVGLQPPRRFKYPVASGLQPVDIARLPGTQGGVLVLERNYLPNYGNTVRLRHLPSSSFTASAPNLLEPRLLLELRAAEHNVDNFEGLAVLAGEGEETVRVLMVSDDNFSRDQRTILYEFEVSV